MSAAVARGIHRLWDDPPWVLDDPFALPLVGDGWEELARQSVALARPPYQARAGVLLRSRYPEDQLAARPYAQYVVLGAGLDTFAWRRPDFLRRGAVFEVDHPDTQAWKRARAAAIALPASARHVLVPADFARDALAACLTEAGFDWSAPTLFSWVGTTMYLERDAIAGVLRAIARSAPGSVLVMSYNPSPELLGDVERTFLADVAALVQGMGEPLRSFFTPEEMAQLTRACGLRIGEAPDTGELTARYFAGRPDGMRPVMVERLLSLRV